MCELNNLVITGTTFPHKSRHKISWISPNGKTENQIDHVLISKQHRTSILDTGAMRRADARIDHELIKSKIRIKLKKQKQNADIGRKKYDVTKLQQLEKRRTFILELKNRFQVLEGLESVEDIWENMIQGYNETADSKLGVKEKEEKPWISSDSWKVIEERKQLKLQLTNSRSERLKRSLRNKYSIKDREVKRSMRNDRRKGTEDMITEAERAASNGHMKTVYEITRVLSNVKKGMTTAMKDKEGKILSSQDERKKRWKEHFQ
ncbi:uncharacterized protein LOC134235688 [Saccostrea cucullata]|uniref:uncharacterized protein LOC134235688 n=1 Tax=Saccostrea cuccullata TaxID=36930 RepID=UPI002ED01690